MTELFDKSTEPRIFALPPGVDFAQCLARGLNQRLIDLDPSAIARITIWTNTRRSARAIEDAFSAPGAAFLPDIRVISDIATDPMAGRVGQNAFPVPPFRRKLLLASLIFSLLEKEPELAPRTAVFDLADSLAELLDEAQHEGVDLDAIADIDTAEFASHWEKNRKFLGILAEYTMKLRMLHAGGHQRLAVEALIADWRQRPPVNPIIVAGSTGSRGATAILMHAVARLSQGAIILPGFDTNLTLTDWLVLNEDHAQFRFAKMLQDANPKVRANWAKAWTTDSPFAPERNELVTLAMRPVLATSDWIDAGPGIRPKLGIATQGIALIEAANAREEATAIAVALRRAFGQRKKSALVTSDRSLARRVTAALAQWGIRPDDSAGTPLALTAPGILLRNVLDIDNGAVSATALLTILVHPLCGGVAVNRIVHLEYTRMCERTLLRGGPPQITGDTLRRWIDADAKQNKGLRDWAHWLAGLLELTGDPRDLLAQHVSCHIALAQQLSAGLKADLPELWLKPAGKAAQALLQSFAQEADQSGTLSNAEYRALFRSEMSSAGDIRDEAFVPHQRVAIWGTLEARIQSAELVVLGGLNEGVWPTIPAADPWLNRVMRARLGMLSPERKIGLAAHDFQQAIAAKEVILSRSVRDNAAPTLPSRWLARLTNLLDGLGDEGTEALAAMRRRGASCIDIAAALEKPKPEHDRQRAKRPAPSPPVKARPSTLSVTQIETLITDPFAVYARHVLKLKRLDPLGREPTQMERGSILHQVMEAFIAETKNASTSISALHLIQTAERVLTELVPWPESRRLWLAQVLRGAEKFVVDEAARRGIGMPGWLEEKGAATVPLAARNFTLTAKADRIDITGEGRLRIYDYKSGSVPGPTEIDVYAKQLLLEGAIAERGGFATANATAVQGLEYLTLSHAGKNRELQVGKIGQTWSELAALLGQYEHQQTGYPARIRTKYRNRNRDYDHLARLGEWEDGDPFDIVRVP